MNDEYPPYEHIRVERRGIAAYVTLARPEAGGDQRNQMECPRGYAPIDGSPGSGVAATVVPVIVPEAA